MSFNLVRTLTYISLSIFLFATNCSGQDTTFFKAGTANWILSIPYVNSFHLQTNENYKSSTGFWGLSTGLEYFYKENKYISVNVGVASDFFLPVPVGADIWGKYESISTLFVNARHNNVYRHLEFGYGINLSSLNWSVSDNIDSTFVPITKHNLGLGLGASIQYRLFKRLKIGLLYQPNILNFSEKTRLDYQHFISLEFMWKIRLRHARP